MASCVISAPLFAAQGPSPFHMLLSGEVRQDTNANRAPSNDDQLSETQITTSVNVNGRYDEYKNVLADVNYRWSETDYREDSQLTDPTLTGEASLNIGGRADFYLLSFTHASTELLVDPTQEDDRSNRENRDTIGASVTFKNKPTSTNQLSMTFSRTDVKYDEITFNNTERLVSQLNYTRQMSRINSGGAQLSQSQITYPSFDDSDYDTTLFYLYFQRQLRELSYYAAVGLNQTSSSAGDNDSPYAQFNIQYSAGVSVFSLALSRLVTDSSAGQSRFSGAVLDQVLPGDVPLEDGVAIADGSFAVRDQIERDSASLSYNSPALCARCSLTTSVSYEKDHYFNSPDQNSIDFSANLRLVYQVRSTSSLSASIRHTAFEFTERLDANNYEQNSVRISWGWRSRTSLSLAVFVEAVERNFDQSGSYSGDEYGLSLSYQLF